MSVLGGTTKKVETMELNSKRKGSLQFSIVGMKHQVNILEFSQKYILVTSTTDELTNLVPQKHVSKLKFSPIISFIIYEITLSPLYWEK